MFCGSGRTWGNLSRAGVNFLSSNLMVLKLGLLEKSKLSMLLSSSIHLGVREGC